MQKLHINSKKVLPLLFSLLLLFSGCDNLNFGGDIRDQINDDLSVIYRFYEYPDKNSKHKDLRLMTGKSISEKDFPKFEHEDTLLVGWQYLKNYNTDRTTLPSNFKTNQKNYISEITVGNSSENLYAIWKTKCVVTLVTNSDIEVEPLVVPEGDLLILPQMETKRGNYRLWAWYTDPDLKELYNWANPVMGDFTLYAEWVEVRTVTYYKNDGSEDKAEVDYRYDCSSYFDDCMFSERQGYGFVGWSDSPDGAVKYYNGDPTNTQTDSNGNYLPLQENIELWAVWSSDVVTVTYVDVSGNFTALTARYGRNAHITVGRVLEANQNYYNNLYFIWKLTGKELAGYSTTSSANPPYEFDSFGGYTGSNGKRMNAYPVTGDKTFYAHVDPIQYLIHFRTLDSSGSYYIDYDYCPTQTVIWDNKIIKPAVKPIIAYHTFENWYQGAGQYSNPSTVMLASNPFDFETIINDETTNGVREIWLYAKFTLGGNSTGDLTGTVTFVESPESDINVDQVIGANSCTFTAPDMAGYNYTWYFKGALESGRNSNSEVFDTSSLKKGSYDICVIISNGTKVYSWSGQIIKS